MKRITTVTLLALLAASAAPLAAQDPAAQELPRSIALGGALHYGAPQGEFANNVSGVFGGNGFIGWQVGNTPLILRADLGFSIYGSETRRVPLGTGVLGLINVDVTTTNNIFNGGVGLQAGVPGPNLRPYVGGSVGFASFVTSSSVSGSSQQTSEAFASSTNSSDATFARTLWGGLYIPIGSGGGALDLGVRYHWNGEAHYLTDRDISFDGRGDPVLSPRWSRADLITFQVGFAFKRR